MRIVVLNGPNLNNLGKRDATLYGSVNLLDINLALTEKAIQKGVEIVFFQSNHEGELIDYIQEISGNTDALIINAGALTHYGLSLKDAIIDCNIPTVEIHVSNIHNRESYRRHSVLESIVIGQVAGFGWKGYLYAFDLIVDYYDKTS